MDKDKDYDKYYKRIEAMYYKGFSIDEIVNNIRGREAYEEKRRHSPYADYCWNQHDFL